MTRERVSSTDRVARDMRSARALAIVARRLAA